MFRGKVAEAQVVPEILKGDTIDLEGHPIRVLPAAQSDTIYSMYIFIPELSAVFYLVAGASRKHSSASAAAVGWSARRINSPFPPQQLLGLPGREDERSAVF